MAENESKPSCRCCGREFKKGEGRYDTVCVECYEVRSCYPSSPCKRCIARGLGRSSEAG